MAKKSQAQINRMIKRAQARGETYEPPPPPSSRQDDESNGDATSSSSPKKKADSKEKAATSTTTTQLTAVEQAKLEAARKLTAELSAIENNEALKAKQRRSAKRKAEGIAAESAGCPATELVEWYTAYQKEHTVTDGKKRKKGSTDQDDGQAHSKNPYIAFVGQLSYDTSQDAVLEHIRQTLGEEFDVSNETVKIRLLTNEKTGKSRGMAFVEVDNPELLYALLRLHQTFLNGRRINVERSAGGRGATKKQKLEQYRKEQQEYVSSVVDKMLQEFYANGSIQPDELDEGVIALFNRHSANVVQAALERYVETDGRQKDNPCAYLTCLVGKMASEGIFPSKEEDNTDKRKADKRSANKRPGKARTSTKGEPSSPSVFETEGVNMRAAQESTSKDISKIFPSYNRGRGRGGKP